MINSPSSQQNHGYARILIDRTEGTVLDYAIPEFLKNRVQVGARVRVSLREAEVMGIVLSLQEVVAFAKVKSILEVMDYGSSRSTSCNPSPSLTSSEEQERPLLSLKLMRLAHWMADYYGASLDAVFRSLVPQSIRNRSLNEKKITTVSLVKKPSLVFLKELSRRAPRQKRILDTLLQAEGTLRSSQLLQQADANMPSLHALEKSGWVLLKQESVSRDPFANEELLPSPIPKLNTDQQRAVEKIDQELTRIFHTDHLRRPGSQMDVALDSHCDLDSMDAYSPASKCSSALTRSLPLVSPFQGCLKAVSPAVSRPPVVPHQASQPLRHDQYEISGLTRIFNADCEETALLRQPVSLPFLLHGVTGSGKTEVYLRIMEKALALGKSVLILVPEIALTPQTVERFRARLEQTQEKRFIAVLHSHLSHGERHDEWLRLHRGEARIVIGARSAIFAPLDKLGLIIVDEEHETSYKQEETPRYHARDVAVMRARYEGAVLVLGSATPAIESMHNVHQGKYRLLELPERADHQRMPLIRVIDMRLQGKQKGADAILSVLLRKAIAERLERSEQIILFLNRRGFASALLCPQCGTACSCPNCSLSLTFHRATEQLLCHLCGHHQKPPTTCPSCHETGILYSGVGTQRVEAAVAQAFPEARSFRIDADTMQRKGSYQETFDRFRKQQIDILIGTQMIAKGLDFPNVTLVGIINGDTSLHAPDFRAGERTFQLLTQVAGRAGRGDREGEVMIQTYSPESPSIQFARHHDYHGFFEQEVVFRKNFGYPPFEKMILIQLRGRLQEQVALEAASLRHQLRLTLPDAIKVGEAIAAPLERAHGYYRFHVALHGFFPKSIKATLRKTLSKSLFPSGIIVTMDVDPQSLM